MSKLEVDAIEPQSGTTLTLGASGDAVNIASGASITDFKSTGIDDNATSTAITIDSSERVGIGNTSPSFPLSIESAENNILHIHSTDSVGGLSLSDNSGSTQLASIGGDLRFVTGGDANTGADNGSEAMRITSDQRVLVGKTTNALSSVGIELTKSNGALLATRSGGQPLFINRLTNDGTLVSFYQDTTEEGTISVSGGTVSYNGFTGTHWSRFTNNSKPTILKGTVLESLDEMCDWYNLEFETTDEEGNTSTQKIPHVLTDTQSNGDVITYNHEGTDVQATIVKEADIKHMKSKVSDTVDAKNVYGVFVAYDEDGEGYNDFYVASVGSFVVRIKANETIAKGDLLQSNGDGTAKVQTDDNVKSSSFAKVLSTTVIETYEDGSFIVPCSLMC